MNREWVEVVANDDGGIWVQSQQRSACDSCQARSGCGQQALTKLGRPVRVWVPTQEIFNIGQAIMVELPQGGLALSAIMLYGIPLLALIFGAALGQAVGNDLYAVMLGVLFLGMGLLASKHITQRYKTLWQPKIVPLCASTVVGACDAKAD